MSKTIIPDLEFNSPAENLAHLRLLVQMSQELLARMEQRIAATETAFPHPPLPPNLDPLAPGGNSQSSFSE